MDAAAADAQLLCTRRRQRQLCLSHRGTVSDEWVPEFRHCLAALRQRRRGREGCGSYSMRDVVVVVVVMMLVVVEERGSSKAPLRSFGARRPLARSCPQIDWANACA